MKRGPKPQPTALKVARGNPGKRRLNAAEPKPAAQLPPCPSHLKGEARKAWQRFAKVLTVAGIATVADATALELLCTSLALYAEALAYVQKHGPIWLEKGDSKIPKFAYSPYWSVMNREWKKITTLLREFGLTPSSRSGVVAIGPTAVADPFKQYLQSA